MNRRLIVLLVRLALGAVMPMIFAGCEVCDDFLKNDLERKVAELNLQLGKISDRADAARQGLLPKDLTGLKIAAKANGAGPAGMAIPNQSEGTFKAQVTVAFIKEVDPGSSSGVLLYTERDPATGDEFTWSMTVSVSEFLFEYTTVVTVKGPGLASPIDLVIHFSSAADLQIEQDMQALIFRARRTNSSAPEPFQEVARLNRPVSIALPFTFGVGIQNYSKGDEWLFTNPALEGEGIGGRAEYSVTVQLRDSVEFLRAARAKINLVVPDLAGATADLDAAEAARSEAKRRVKTALLDGTLQFPGAGADAHAALGPIGTELADVRQILATQNPARARQQVARIDKLEGKLMGTMANMLGWKAPPFAKIPKEIISFRVP